jgi:hypothetical protein
LPGSRGRTKQIRFIFLPRFVAGAVVNMNLRVRQPGEFLARRFRQLQLE